MFQHVGIECVEIGAAHCAVPLVSGAEDGVGFTRPSDPISKDGAIVSLQNSRHVILQVLAEDCCIPILHIIHPRKSIRLHSSVSVFVLRVGHSDGVVFLLYFYDFVDVAVVEFGVE